MVKPCLKAGNLHTHSPVLSTDAPVTLSLSPPGAPDSTRLLQWAGVRDWRQASVPVVQVCGPRKFVPWGLLLCELFPILKSPKTTIRGQCREPKPKVRGEKNS